MNHAALQAVILLADAAQVADSKLYVLGAGWSFTSSPMSAPMAVAVLIYVPWDETNTPHRLSVELFDADGHRVLAPGGGAPIQVANEFVVGRPPQAKPGSSQSVPFAISIGPLQLEPESRYEWRMTIDGESRDEWRVAFGTRAAGK